MQLKLRRIYRITTVEGGFDKMQPPPYSDKAISMAKTNFKAYNPNLSSILANWSLQENLQGNPRLIRTGYFSNVHILLIKGFSNKGLRQIEYQETLNNALLSVAFQRKLLHLKEINQLERRITTRDYFHVLQAVPIPPQSK